MTNFIIRAGVSSEVPDLVLFIATETKSPIPENALYVGLYDDGKDGDLIGCWIFYSPFTEPAAVPLRGIKIGAALAPGKTWGTNLRVFVTLRELIEHIVFVGFKYDFMEADIESSNIRNSAFLKSARFVFVREFTDSIGRMISSYRLERGHEHPFQTSIHIGI